MVRSSKQNARAPRKRTRKNRTGKAFPEASSVVAYRQLLLDPCNAPLVAPCAGGTGTGLYVRIKKYYTPSFTIPTPVNPLTAMTVGLRLNPYTSGVTELTSYGGLAFTGTSSLLEAGTFLEADYVSSYRITAACVRWVPSGPIMERQGVVHTGYTPQNFAASGKFPNNVKPICSRSVTNGSEMHEAVWIPSHVDELEFKDRVTSGTAPDNQGATSFIMVENVDLVESSAPLGESRYTPKGYFEVTYVAEWAPDVTSGLTSPSTISSGGTFASVIKTFKDLGAIATNPTVRKMAAGAANAALAYYFQSGRPMLTSGRDEL